MHIIRQHSAFVASNTPLLPSQLQTILRIMIQNSQELGQLESHLQRFALTTEQFNRRFEFLKAIEDPYVRYYDICNDVLQEHQRVAVRRYIADDQPRYFDVMENLKSYTLLSDIGCICKFIAFCFHIDSGQILAAFEYNHNSFMEILQRKDFGEQRDQFYVFVARELIKIVEQLKAAGIQLEEVIPQALLLEKSQENYKIKVLYDEREKRYDKIQEGIKVYASPEKIRESILMSERSEVSGEQGDSVDEQEVVFQMGLFLLDLVYEYELGRSQADAPFAKDLPIVRSNLTHKSYIVFDDKAKPLLNQELIVKKTQFLDKIPNHFIKKLLQLIKKMAVQRQRRLTLKELVQQIEILQAFLVNKQPEVKDNIDYATPIKLPEKPAHNTSENIQGIKKDTNHNQYKLQNNVNSVLKQTLVSRTTLDSANQGLSNNPKSQGLNIYAEKETSVIPRSKLLSQINCHKNIIEKLDNFIIQLEKRNRTISKEYYDKSQYFGQVDSFNFKRNGLGIYVYIQGDIYFGTWSENSLAEGTYLFKNGDSFQGIVKCGKQGWGKYYYSNGNIYEGQWKNDLKYGNGKMVYPNGDIYEGMWLNGKKNGQGTYYYSNGTVYQGNFANGKKNGFGVITFTNKTKIQAFWNQTHIQGPGKVFYNNGNYFEGNYDLSEKQGQGLYVWEDTQYYGGFEKDAMQGYAKIKFSQIQYYQGPIKNGKRNGNGTYKYPNGDEFRGQWKNDQKIYGFYRFKEGATFEGRFKLNKISYGVMVYENGQSYQGQFKEGERHGLGTYRDIMKQILFQGTWQRDQFVSPY